jgi:biopolymer transport protein ExbB
MKKKYIFIILFIVCVFNSFLVVAQNDSKSEVESYIKTVEETRGGMSLWQMVKSGGVIIILLALLSVLAVAMIIYNFSLLNEAKLSPKHFAQNLIKNLEAGKDKAVKSSCSAEDNIIAKITRAGFEKQSKGAHLVRESMEGVLRTEIGNLWKSIGYLADIGNISPLIGLLGTVIGMIRAFNAIAFQTAVVKPILLAGGVSQAMVTTAAGLIVAIPAMIFYAYFRGRVHDITNIVENYSTDIIKIVEAKASSKK